MRQKKNKMATILRELTDDYLAALELGQNGRVSNLSSEICSQLVELYEDGLEGDENDDTQYRIVNSVCHALRKQAQLAAAYNDVIQFVHVQDMICLSQMLDAIPVKEMTTTTLGHYEQLASVLRKSIYLLRSINLADKDGDGDDGERVAAGEMWLDAARLEWFQAISTFPTCAIDVGGGGEALRAPGARLAPIEDKEALQELCQAQRAAHLSADWFLHFLRKGPLRSYPIDRFALLIALWLVGASAGHWTLEQLMGELVARVAHEESNGADDEELLQLRQTGTFWLSHHKRHRQPAGLTPIGGSSSPVPSSLDSDSELEVEETSRLVARETPRDWRQRLCQLIDVELIKGLACHWCGQCPDGPLAPIRSSGCSCSSSNYHCARSHRPLHLLPLADLLKIRRSATRLVVLWPSEWARQAWLASCAQNHDDRLDRRRGPTEERLQMGDKFERLTVVQPRADSSASSQSQSDSECDEDDDDNDCAHDGRPEVAAHRLGQRQVATFMRRRSGPSRHATPDLSESAKLLQWQVPGTVLTLSAGDLLLMGSSPDGLSQVYLSTTKLASGNIWSCSTQSSVSGLMLGCGRLFVDRQDQKSDQCACCGRPLLRLQTLAEAHRAGRV